MMQYKKFLNNNALLLCILSFFINIAFLFFTVPEYYSISQIHGQVGYNFYRYNSFGINSKISSYIDSLQENKQRLIDYHDMRSYDFGYPSERFPINDTIGYGVVLGLLWKLTGSLRFFDVILLQIIIFSLCMFLFYRIAVMLFHDVRTALFGGLALLIFFPLISLNIHAVRDIWAYYGLIVLVYSILSFFHYTSWRTLIFGCSFFSVCQYIRPTLSLAVLTFFCVLLIYAFFSYRERKKSLQILGILFVSNAIFFWIPFITYNKQTYDRYFVGPVGQDLLEGLGEFTNTWGYHLNDLWIADYIGKKYNVVYGTPEFDERAKEEFWQAFSEDPLFYFKGIVRRIPSLLVPALPWIFYSESPYKLCITWYEKLCTAFCSWPMVVDFFLRHIYVRLYLLLGYAGLFLMLQKKQYFAAALLVVGVICAGFGKLPSHIEYRYLVPFYWPFALFFGYFLAQSRRYFYIYSWKHNR